MSCNPLSHVENKISEAFFENISDEAQLVDVTYPMSVAEGGGEWGILSQNIAALCFLTLTSLKKMFSSQLHG